MRTLLSIATCAALTSCGGGSGQDDVPATAELYGTWMNVTAGTVHGFVFAASSTARPELAGKAQTFELYSYSEGTPTTMVEAGTYAVKKTTFNENGAQITDDALVTDVLWDSGGTLAGMTFGNGIQGWDGDSFVLRGTSDGDRTYAQATALP